MPLHGSASFVAGDPGQQDRLEVFTLPSLGIGQPFGYDPNGDGEETWTAGPRRMSAGDAQADDLALLDQLFAGGRFLSERAP